MAYLSESYDKALKEIDGKDRRISELEAELEMKDKVLDVLADELVAWRQPSWRRRCLLWTPEKIIAEATAKARELIKNEQHTSKNSR